jgi:hypothetical protein
LVALALLASTAGSSAGTSVFRCTSEDGAVEFRQRPCDGGLNEENLIIEDRRTGWTPAPAGTDRGSKDARKTRKRASGSSRELAKARREEKCWKKRELLDEVNWTLKRGYKAGRGNVLRRKRRAYEDYISRFCR